MFLDKFPQHLYVRWAQNEFLTPFVVTCIPHMLALLFTGCDAGVSWIGVVFTAVSSGTTLV